MIAILRQFALCAGPSVPIKRLTFAHLIVVQLHADIKLLTRRSTVLDLSQEDPILKSDLNGGTREIERGTRNLKPLLDLSKTWAVADGPKEVNGSKALTRAGAPSTITRTSVRRSTGRAFGPDASSANVLRHGWHSRRCTSIAAASLYGKPAKHISLQVLSR